MVPTYFRATYEDFSILEEQKFAVEKKKMNQGGTLCIHILGAKNDKGGTKHFFWPVFLGLAKSANSFSSANNLLFYSTFERANL